jgi:predicted Zn-dependent peptidase
LAAQVLGGGFAGRLNINLRQDKGYSYGFFGQTPIYSGGLVWMSGGTVQTDKTKETVVELAKELRGIAGEKPVAAKELDDARLGYLRNYAAGFGTNRDVAGRVVELWSRRWPMAELEREPAELAKVQLGAVLAAAKKYAVPGEGTILLVGDRAKIEAGVRGAKLGDVILLDSEGRPLGAK